MGNFINTLRSWTHTTPAKSEPQPATDSTKPTRGRAQVSREKTQVAQDREGGPPSPSASLRKKASGGMRPRLNVDLGPRTVSEGPVADAAFLKKYGLEKHYTSPTEEASKPPTQTLKRQANTKRRSSSPVVERRAQEPKLVPLPDNMALKLSHTDADLRFSADDLAGFGSKAHYDTLPELPTPTSSPLLKKATVDTTAVEPEITVAPAKTEAVEDQKKKNIELPMGHTMRRIPSPIDPGKTNLERFKNLLIFVKDGNGGFQRLASNPDVLRTLDRALEKNDLDTIGVMINNRNLRLQPDGSDEAKIAATLRGLSTACKTISMIRDCLPLSIPEGIYSRDALQAVQECAERVMPIIQPYGDEKSFGPKKQRSKEERRQLQAAIKELGPLMIALEDSVARGLAAEKKRTYSGFNGKIAHVKAKVKEMQQPSAVAPKTSEREASFRYRMGMVRKDVQWELNRLLPGSDAELLAQEKPSVQRARELAERDARDAEVLAARKANLKKVDTDTSPE